MRFGYIKQKSFTTYFYRRDNRGSAEIAENKKITLLPLRSSLFPLWLILKKESFYNAHFTAEITEEPQRSQGERK